MLAQVKLAAVALRALVPRPLMWPVAARQLLRLARDGWWRRAPFLPLPPAPLERFRAEAMYGDPSAVPTSSDLVRWLRWCAARQKAGLHR